MYRVLQEKKKNNKDAAVLNTALKFSANFFFTSPIKLKNAKNENKQETVYIFINLAVILFI